MYHFVWISILGIYIQTLTCCEDKWIPYYRFGVCYRVFSTPRLEWEDARVFCTKKDAQLTDLYDYNEQMFIKDNLLGRIRGHGVWIGISDYRNEGDWRWVNNSKSDIDKFKWWPGNPNNGDSLFDLFLDEDCVEISLKSRYRGQLNDYHCEKKMSFICKKKDTTITTTSLLTSAILSTIASESDMLREIKNEATLPIVTTLAVLCLIALLVAATFFYLRRYRKQTSTQHNYEDANFTASANDNIYTCLDTNSQSALNNNSACATFNDQTSNHEYHSVHFSTQDTLYESVNCNKLNTESCLQKPPSSSKC